MKAVNLLPGDQRGSAKTSPVASPEPKGGSAFGAYVVLGVLAFAVAATAAYVLSTNVIKDRKSELATVTQQAEATQRQAAALQAYADFKTLAEQRVATVNGLAQARFDWERTLRDLSKAMPSDVHLTAMNGTVGTQVTGAAGGSSALRSAIQAPALELSGCTTTQSSVARMMSRLQNVRGVTRVSLAKSDKDDTTGVTSVPTTPDGGTPAQLCPKGSPPAFNVVVFFERSAINPAAAPNTGASSAPATGTTTTPNASATPGAASSTAPNAAEGAAGTSTAPSTGTSTQTQGVSAK